MDLTLDEVSEAAREAVKAVCVGQAGAAGPVRAREAEPLGHDAKLWADLCSIGLPGLAVDESLGGGGAGLAALVAVSHQLGAILAPVPLVEHTVALRLLVQAAPDHPDIAAAVAGDIIATIAPRVRRGIGEAVPAGAVAELVIGVDEGRLVAVRSEPPLRSLPNQGSLPVADRDLNEGVRTVLLTGPAAAAAFEAAESEWLTLVASWLGGLSTAALELVVRWVKERHQFGVPIGSFQGVQHGLADLPGLIDGTVLLAGEAAWSLTTAEPAITGATGGQLALMALLFAADTARQVTGRVVQYHGGLGVAEEHDAQLYYRRARAYPLLTGTPRHQLRRLGAKLVDEGQH